VLANTQTFTLRSKSTYFFTIDKHVSLALENVRRMSLMGQRLGVEFEIGNEKPHFCCGKYTRFHSSVRTLTYLLPSRSFLNTSNTLDEKLIHLKFFTVT
jgi:hypothetical protein